MNWNWKVALLVVVLALSAVSVYGLGLQYGIDLEGGTSIQLELEKEATDEEMDTIVSVLNERLNSLGVKDIQVRPLTDNRHVTVEIVDSTSSEQQKVEDILRREGVFIAQFNGETFAMGEDIERVNEIQLKSSGKEWVVPFDLKQSAAEDFTDLAEGKPNYPVDMWVDPPRDSVIIASEQAFNVFNQTLSEQVNPDATVLIN
ncbi:MAG: preprotein translocase subunit SecD, partial [Halanaerobiales bacterium]